MSDEKDPLSDPGHLFDQTNGVVEGLEGESTGEAGSDASSPADRDVDADGSPIDSGSDVLTEGGSGSTDGTRTDR